MLGLLFLLLAGCAALDEKEGQWIFQPSTHTWGGYGAAEDMRDTWIAFDSRLTGKHTRLHALWLDAPPMAPLDAQPGATRDGAQHAAVAGAHAPVLLYLHGSRWNVTSSAFRARAMQELGFSVLALDYRGFGKSDAASPSESVAYEDARAAWDWLAQRYPDRPRYIFGHSLGGAIAIDLASKVSDEAGTIVEGSFTSIADVIGTTQWGWLPLRPLITQRFDALDKVGRIGSPLLVVHGSADRLIQPALGRRLFEAARGPKEFVLVEGGSHHNTILRGQSQYREAIAKLFGLHA